MWLDRLSGHSTPSTISSAPPNSRSFSPAPARRPSYLAPQAASQRPGYNPRSSSLSLVSNDSTNSLLGNTRKVNGTGVKRRVALPDYPEPLEVLEKLLDSESKAANGTGNNNNEDAAQDEDELEGEFDFEGLSLRQFIESDILETGVSHVHSSQTVEECMYTTRELS
jgi:hypothetical protein